MKNDDLHNNSETYLAKWLDGELTDQQLQDLVSVDDYAAYLKLRKGLSIHEQLNAPIDATFKNIQSRISKKQTKVKPLYASWYLGVAASIVLIFGIFTFLPSDIIVETGYGESKTVTLLDGSEVILNAKSKLSYDEGNWDKERKLSLEGEAYFKVAKGKTFSVETEHGTVSVLGTQFNVIADEGYFNVVCYEGKVAVKTSETKNILLPGDGIKNNNNSFDLTKTTDKMPSWIFGESTFRSVPLRQVIRALEDQYQIGFDTEGIDDSEIFTGSFPHDSLNIALKTVFETLNITYNEKEKRNIKLRYKE